MAQLPIVTWPDKRLRSASVEVELYDTKLQQLCDSMIEAMFMARGIGLAAIQVGVPLRVIVIDARIVGLSRRSDDDDDDDDDYEGEEIVSVSEETDGVSQQYADRQGESGDVNNDEDADDEPIPPPLVFVNPVIIERSKSRETYVEGCLSFPDITAEVSRADTCLVRYSDINGIKHELACDEILATCIQHEIDHLNGRMFFDRIPAEKRHLLLRRYAKAKLQQGID